MKGPFNLLDKFPYLVVAESLTQTQRACLDLEGGKRGSQRSSVQTRAQNAVHDLFKGLAGSARFRPELGRHIVVKG